VIYEHLDEAHQVEVDVVLASIYHIPQDGLFDGLLEKTFLNDLHITLVAELIHIQNFKVALGHAQLVCTYLLLIPGEFQYAP
jgi:hypothetical protein